jgi:hypothetical protein
MNELRSLLGNLGPAIGLGLLIFWMDLWAIPVGILIIAVSLKYGTPNWG